MSQHTQDDAHEMMPMSRPITDALWQQLTLEVTTEMRAWRLAHPKATLREIEVALDARLNHMQVLGPVVKWLFRLSGDRPRIRYHRQEETPSLLWSAIWSLLLSCCPIRRS